MSYTVNKLVLLWILWSSSKMTQQSWSPLNIKRYGKREQDGRGVDGCRVHLCPWIHQEYTFRHRRACRYAAAAAAAKSLQSCPTLCDPIDGSPPGSPVPGILQARTLEWVAISFSDAWKWKMKVKSLSRVRLLGTPWTAVYQAPLSMGFSRQEHWSGVPLPSIEPRKTW